MSKKRCPLCGGKLVNNKCILCGMNASPHEPNSNNREKRFKKITILVSCIIAISFCILSMFFNLNRRVEELKQKVYKINEPNREEHEIDELYPKGETYMGAFAPGIYVVGIHIPEGTYSIRLQGDSSIFILEDLKNSIYIEKKLEKTNDTADEYIEDLQCYNGSKIYIKNGKGLEFYSENARINTMEGFKNPLKTTVEIKDRFVSGHDFPAGTYNINLDNSITSGVVINIPPNPSIKTTDSIQIDIEPETFVHHNIYMPEGTEIFLKDNPNDTLSLIPSDMIPKNYEGYYHIFQK